MKVKVNEASGTVLDWMVAKCDGVKVEYINDDRTKCLLRVSPFTSLYIPSTDWSQGGPIIERERIQFRSEQNIQYRAFIGLYGADAVGPTHLIAAMRCYVASKLGEEVEVPDELF